MAWILVFEHDGKVFSLASPNPSDYRILKPYANKRFSGVNILVDRTDIPNERYEDAYGLVFNLVQKMNWGEEVDLGGELERLLSEV